MASNTPESYNSINSPTLNNEVFANQPSATDYEFGRKVTDILEKFGGSTEQDPKLGDSLARIARMLDSIEEIGGTTARQLAELKRDTILSEYHNTIATLEAKHRLTISDILSGEAANDSQEKLAA